MYVFPALLNHFTPFLSQTLYFSPRTTCIRKTNKLQRTRRKLISESLILRLRLVCRAKCAHIKQIHFNCWNDVAGLKRWLTVCLMHFNCFHTNEMAVLFLFYGSSLVHMLRMHHIFRAYFHHFCHCKTEMRKLSQLLHAMCMYICCTRFL